MRAHYKSNIEKSDTKNWGTERKKVLRVLIIITFLALITFLIMRIIDPNSRALPTFLFGFGFIFVLIVLIALYFNYISNIYKDIRNNRSKSE